MNPGFSVFACIFPFACAAAAPLLSQESGATEPPTRSIVFRLYPVGVVDTDNLVYLMGPEEPAALSVRPFARSRPHEYRGPEELVFYRVNGEENGAVRRAGVVRIPPDLSELLLFLFPASDVSGEPGAFRIVAVDDSIRALPPGHVRLVNGTGVELSGVFGDRRIRIAPGAMPVLAAAGNRGEDLFVGLAVLHEGEWRRVLQNRWRFFPGNRTIMLLLPPDDPGSFRIRAYRISEYISGTDD